MGIESISALLVGEVLKNSPELLRWLDNRGCDYQFAPSYRSACNLISRTRFDLVLSQYQLPDRTAFPLLDWFAGSAVTLFFFKVVEDGSLWLPMLERGKRCVGASVLRSNDLTETLGKVLDTAIKSDELEAVASGVDLKSFSTRIPRYVYM
jgi:hypothetical protein